MSTLPFQSALLWSLTSSIRLGSSGILMRNCRNRFSFIGAHQEENPFMWLFFGTSPSLWEIIKRFAIIIWYNNLASSAHAQSCKTIFIAIKSEKNSFGKVEYHFVLENNIGILKNKIRLYMYMSNFDKIKNIYWL